MRHLFAAYELGEDKLFGHVKPRKTRARFLEFCRYLRSLYPPSVRIAIICDNFSPHLSTRKEFMGFLLGRSLISPASVDRVSPKAGQRLDGTTVPISSVWPSAILERTRPDENDASASAVTLRLLRKSTAPGRTCHRRERLFRG